MSIQLHSLNTSTSNKYKSEVNQRLSEMNAVMCLLNCYIREYALSKEQVIFDDNQADAPALFKMTLNNQSGLQHIRLLFPESKAVILIKADQVSLLGRTRFVNQPYLKHQGLAWHPIDATTLARLIVEHLALVMTTEVNTELLEQIQNSINITRLFIENGNHPNAGGNYSNLIQSEQSLLWGHAMHPAPKSRDGVTFDQLISCSPEVQAKFPLYWFKIAPQFLKQMSGDEFPPADLIGQVNPTDELLYPCHPWEVDTILKQPLVKKAIKAGLILGVGTLGEDVFPTSSVRTVLCKKTNSFMKFSIHVRLTNCVRKNAWYELESAVQLSKLIKPHTQKNSLHCPKFSIMHEPAASTLDLSSIACADEIDNVKEVIECFGILYRDGISHALQEQYQPEMAGALFAWDKKGDSVCVQRIQALAMQQNSDYGSLASKWFDAYLDALLPGVFHYFFDLGIAFEPHLQNTVVGFENGLPAHIWLRDLEGTKLMQSHWPKNSLQEMSKRARSSVYYSRELGWNRIAYCTLINNVSEAIFHLANGNRELEASLWLALAEAVKNWQVKEGTQPELQGFVNGDAIPSKNNLTTRLLKHADSLSSYTNLPNPLLHLSEK
jgi:siderophore synthetase component